MGLENSISRLVRHQIMLFIFTALSLLSWSFSTLLCESSSEILFC